MSFAVGTLGLDSASLNTAADATTAFTDGARFWFRYSAGGGNTSSNSAFKLCKTGEIANLIHHGFDFIANSEWGAARVEQGSAAGTQDGTSDLAFWKSRGLAKGASIYPSWDVANDTSKYPGVQAYLAAYNKALGGYYHADGLYAPIPALVHFGKLGVIKHGWIPESPAASVTDVPLSSLGLFSTAELKAMAPANSTWDLWQPTKAQMPYAIRYIQHLIAPAGLTSVIWQDGNHWFPGGAADEDVIVVSGPLGSQREALAAITPPHPGGTLTTNPTWNAKITTNAAMNAAQRLVDIEIKVGAIAHHLGAVAATGPVTASDPAWAALISHDGARMTAAQRLVDVERLLNAVADKLGVTVT